GSSSLRREGSDGQEREDRPSLFPHTLSWRNKTKAALLPGSHYPSHRGFPISRCSLASRPRPMTKKRHLGPSGGGGSRAGRGGSLWALSDGCTAGRRGSRGVPRKEPQACLTFRRTYLKTKWFCYSLVIPALWVQRQENQFWATRPPLKHKDPERSLSR
ncbi:hypothetical protein LEMLEM_LOCUS1462, partial [Lemmus lemmus]